MLKVLLITYYWPPAGGGGVQRWLKMSKYFSENDIDLTIYTPENPEYPAIDNSSLKEVGTELKIIKRPILEPYSFYKKFVGKKKGTKVYSGFINERPSLKQKLSIWIRGNFFIPDARKFWIKPSIKFLTKFLVDNSFDVVISTGPPHSLHMIALGLKQKMPTIKWIADFRDPWTNIDFYDQLMLTKWADKKHKTLEKKVLKSADLVVTVGRTLAKELQILANIKNVKVITNGYDHLDFDFEIPLDKGFNITHLGSMNGDRNPEVLWKVISDLRDENVELYDNLKINLYGPIDQKIENSLKTYNIESKVTSYPFIPHEEAVRKMKASSVLLLVINNTPNAAGILTGKVFEYLGSGRPILCIGPIQGDVQHLLSEYGNASYISYDNTSACKDALSDFYNTYNNTSIAVSSDFEKFSRKNLAQDYSNLIKSIA